jgi:hypothetical protein
MYSVTRDTIVPYSSRHFLRVIEVSEMHLLAVFWAFLLQNTPSVGRGRRAVCKQMPAPAWK